MIVMKFGGTSVADATRIQDVAKIVTNEIARQPVVVVSAMSQVTNVLEELASLAAKGNHSNKIGLGIKQLRKLHIQTIEKLQLEPALIKPLLATVDAKLTKLSEVLASISALGELTPRGRDLIVSYGERISIHIVAAALVKNGVPATPIEASELIVTNDDFGNAQPKLELSKKLSKPKLRTILDKGYTPVITGFMGANSKGVVTTLGRGGSDYTATIIGYCIDAEEVWIWTDVDGVMTADPKLVPSSHTIPQLSYDEAAELSYFGAKVLHPRTMVPATVGKIPILIKNTLNPTAKGSTITSKAYSHPDGAKAISVLKNLSLVSIQGKGMQGAYGMAAKIFSALALEKINVLFISQASSENNISLVIKKADGKRAVSALRVALASEIRSKKLEPVRMQSELAMVAVVGEGMRNHTGIAGRIFTALGNAKINVIAIAQGSSERNISFVVDYSQAKSAIRCIHDELHFKKLNEVSI